MMVARTKAPPAAPPATAPTGGLCSPWMEVVDVEEGAAVLDALVGPSLAWYALS
jgi:hypothetical protein